MWSSSQALSMEGTELSEVKASHRQEASRAEFQLGDFCLQGTQPTSNKG